MTRFYNLCVEFKKIKLKDVKKVICEKFGWDETDSEDWDKKKNCAGYLVCEGSLFGGMDEKEAHEEIYKALKKINPRCKIQTRFTYMEDLPYGEYGDDLDENEDELQEIVAEKMDKIKKEKKNYA